MTDDPEKTLVEQLEHELGVAAGTALGLEMLEYIGKFTKGRDINWIDLMVWRLTNEGVPLPMTIQVLAARAAYRRLHGDGTRRKISKVWREHSKAVAHASSAFLQGLDGIGAEEADLRAAVSVESEFGHAPKASSLSQDRPSATKQNSALRVLASVGRALQENYPQQAAALAERTALLAADAKEAKKKKKPNKLGTRR